MQHTATGVEFRNFDTPDEVRTFPMGKGDILHIGGGVVGRYTLLPGWRWSEHVRPIAGTEWCEAGHFQYHVSGRLHVVCEGGGEFDLEPGDVSSLPGGHDAWVVGNEPVVVVDWQGAINYAGPGKQ